MVELSKVQYSGNIVKTFLMCGSKSQVVLKPLRKMLRHVEAPAIVESAQATRPPGAGEHVDRGALWERAPALQVSRSPAVQPEKLELVVAETKQILTPVAPREAVSKHSL